jgi:diguanylate cyclase (GGDEF)-like protein
VDANRLGPRDARSAARTAAGLIVASAVSVLVAEVAVMVSGSRSPALAAWLVSLGLIALGLMLWFRQGQLPGLVWFTLAEASVGIVLVLDLITRDAGGGAQVAFLLPVVYAGAFLRAWAAWTVAGSAIIASGVLVHVLLPLDQALTDYVFILVAIVALTMVLVSSGRQQERLVAQLHRVASIDLLTGLATRRALEAVTRTELADASEPSPGTALLLIDVDRFKEVNDAHGHPVGDQVLVHIATLLRGVVRREDTVARFGGDELAVLLSGVDRSVAVRLAESLRRVIDENPMRTPTGQISLTVSIGVAHTAPGAAHLDELYRSADAGLYQAKRDGRDRVVDGSAARRAT